MFYLGIKKLSLSESFNELHFVKQSKGGLAWDVTPAPSQKSSNRSPELTNSCAKSNLEMVTEYNMLNILIVFI